MPHAPEVLQPVIYSVALQLLAYHVALQKGTDKSRDKPRNLFSEPSWTCTLSRTRVDRRSRSGRSCPSAW
jgi:hypothetical protein